MSSENLEDLSTVGTDDLFDKLTEDVVLYKNDNMSPPITICRLSDMKQKSIQALDKESAKFMWFQLLIQTLLYLPDVSTINAKNEMLNVCRSHYNDNDKEQEKIKNFEQTYSCQEAIQWYTRDSFLYRLFNRAFRTEDIDIIFHFRFFISDLFKQMENSYDQLSKSSKILTVYRGQQMEADELEKIQQNIGNIISMNTFLSTTTSRDVAEIFAGDCSERPLYESVIYEVRIDTNIVNKPYVDLSDPSNTDMENEILLSIGFIFRIEDVKQLPSGHWYVSLTATDEQDTKINELLTYFKQEIGKTSSLLQLGEFLRLMGECYKSKRYYEILLKQIPDDHCDRAEVYNNLGLASIDEGDYELAKKYLEQALELDSQYLNFNDSSLAITYNNIGYLYYSTGYYDQALEMYNKAYNIALILLPKTNLELGTIYNNIGMVYMNVDNYKEAIDHFEKALQYKLLSLPKNHPNIANTYNNIGVLHFDNLKYDEALKNLEKALEILFICFSEDHPATAKTQSNIGLIYQKRGNQKEALEYFEKALASQRKSLPENHVDFALTYNNIGLVHYEMKNWDIALNYYEKAKEIYIQTHGAEHPLIATIFHNIGDVYIYGKRNLISGRDYYAKALAVAIKTLPPGHRDIRTYRNNIRILQLRHVFRFGLISIIALGIYIWKVRT